MDVPVARLRRRSDLQPVFDAVHRLNMKEAGVSSTAYPRICHYLLELILNCMSCTGKAVVLHRAITAPK